VGSKDGRAGVIAYPTLRDDQATAVVAFLSRALPRLEHDEGWDHMFSTAYQIGCQALAALGYAEETDWGAVPRKDARLPDILPRWDDICVSVLWLAHQQNLLAYRLRDGAEPPKRAGSHFTVRLLNAPPPPPPNISAACGLGPALAKPDVLDPLQRLGLIDDRQWLPIAETILWRCSPVEWQLRFTEDPRFNGAVEHALATIPLEIKESCRALLTITDSDVVAAKARRKAAQDEIAARHAMNQFQSREPDDAALRRMIAFSRENDLDWLFFRNWRLDQGWLSPDQISRRLEIFHDPVARQMREDVMRRAFPDLTA
jgi:hypothetical protein